jgi:hypothetical protein
MDTTKNRIAELAFKHLANDLSENDHTELNKILRDPANYKFFTELTNRGRIGRDVKKMQQAEVYMKVSWQKIDEAYHFHYKNTAWKKLAVAATLALVAGGVTWYALRKPSQVISTVDPAPTATQLASYYPQSRKGVWKRGASLAVYLDDLKNGLIGSSDAMPVMKNDSELVYSAVQQGDMSLSDTLQTLRGGYYRLRLPDGSKVVLNSASTVFFAPAFGNKERQVSVNGEAYFDVVKDKRPFYVQVPGLKIEVKGTKFNVQAYKEDNIIRTSLVEGNVRVRAGKQMVDLKPGEQAVLTQKKRLEKITDPAAVKKAIGWKEGSFIFKDDNLIEIINELSRYYNLEVQYKGAIPENTYYGIFSRGDSIGSILEHLQKQTGIRFKVDGKKVVIQP